MIRRQPVESSNLKEMGYDSLSKRMEVVFNAAPHLVYTYENVDLSTYLRVLNAQSKGQAFNELIRSKPDRFPYTTRRV